MTRSSRWGMVVVGLVGLVAGCVGATLSQDAGLPPVELALAQAKASAVATPARPAQSFARPSASVWGSGRPMIAAALPPYPPQPSAQKWQQYCVESYQHDLNMTLRAYGDAGWEYVGGDGYRACFRRPGP